MLIIAITVSSKVYAIDYIPAEADNISVWAMDDNRETGYYSLTVDDETYNIELYVYDDDVTYSSNPTMCDNVADQHMCIVKYNHNLTVDADVVVTPQTRKKGFFILVMNKLTNNGTITMTGKGSSAEGQNVYLWRQDAETMFTVPKVGAAATAGNRSNGDRGVDGIAGNNGVNRQTGGGGGGAVIYSNYNSGSNYGSAGGAGTSYSGGAGGGGANHGFGGNSGNAVGLRGGSCYGVNSGNYCQTGVGITNGSTSGYGNVNSKSGTGGLLIMYASILENYGTISSNGIDTGDAGAGWGTAYSFGGASGGGSVNIMYGNLAEQGTITANGGSGKKNPLTYGSRTAKSGDGGAGSVTLDQTITDEEYLHPTISTLTIDGGNIPITFDPAAKEYTISLSAEHGYVNIQATPTYDDATISGIGIVGVRPDGDRHIITITSRYGLVEVYTITFNRDKNDINILQGIKINGSDISNFNSNTTNYSLTIPYNYNEIEIEVSKGSYSQDVQGVGTKTVITNQINVFDIVVTSEDETKTKTYTLNITKPHNSKLKSLEIENFELDKEFDPEVYNYEISVPNETIGVNVLTSTYDEESTVKLTGFAFIKETKTATITVTEPNVSTTTYTITITKPDTLSDKVTKDYSYTGQVQIFTAPADGYYTLEAWGARGSDNGGNGAYTKGTVYLPSGTNLYIYVGNRTNGMSGGWNGGGNALRSDGFGGGGATDFRLVRASETDTVWNEITSLRSRIMVAAGGGGAITWSGGAAGGYGGALVGGSGNNRVSGGSANTPATGGTQTTGGNPVTNGSGTMWSKSNPGTFGVGGMITNYSGTNYGGGAGGGGYWGGASGNDYNGSLNSGAGGSSYISGYLGSVAVESEDSTTPRLDKNGVECTEESALTDITCSYHYSGYEFVDAKMIAGNEAMPNTDGTGTETGHAGNGYARISYQYDETAANALIKTLTTSNGTWSETYNPLHHDYSITHARNKIKFEATTFNNETNVFGIGDIDFKYGYNRHVITSTNTYGYVFVYTFDIYVDAVDDAPVFNEYEIDSNRGRLLSDFDSNKFEYDAIMYQDNFLRYVTYDVDDNVTVDYTNDYNEETNKGDLTYILTRRKPVNKPAGLVDASRLDISKATENDNPGIALNNDKFDISTSGYKITIVDNGLEEYVGCGYNTANKCVGFLVDFGTKVDGIKGYGIEPQDYTDAPRWGATTDTAFVMWLSKDDGGTYKFRSKTNSSDVYDLTVEFLDEEPEQEYTEHKTRYVFHYTKENLDEIDFNYTGKAQTFKAQFSGVYRLEAWGAQGGWSYYNQSATSGSTSRGGYGGYVAGDLVIDKDSELYVYVGEEGPHGVYGTRVRGGWNGGGYGGNYYQGAAGGGGATDFRTVKASTDNTVWNEAQSLRSRIMVAGAGGGAGTWSGAQPGGDAGGLQGYRGSLSGNGHTLGTPGFQTTAGVGGSNGQGGYFGAGGQYAGVYNDHDGGGGSGWYGGASGTIVGGGVASAAGGSSFISGYLGAIRN